MQEQKNDLDQNIPQVELDQTQPIENNAPTPFNPLKDGSTILGFAVMFISLFVFFVNNSTNDFVSNPLDEGVFYVAHVAIIVSFFVVFFTRKKATKWYATRINGVLPWLVAFQIGAFMLNRSMSVFPVSSDWLQVALTFHCLAMVALTFRDFLSEKILNGLYFIMGVGLVIDLYFMIFTLPLAGFGVMAIWFLGLSFYAWSPFLKVLYSLIFMIRSKRFGLHFGKYYLGGIGFALAMILLFNWGWFGLVQKTRAAISNTQSALPEWVRVAQVLPPSVLTEKLLKSNVGGNSGLFGFESIGDRFHDPLVVIGNYFAPIPNLSHEDRSSALKAIFNERKDAERRLWNGDNLRTKNVSTAIELFLSQRLAYTEQTLIIENTLPKDSRWSTQEAIYVFQLPEGGVVTALSLWINDKEQKGFLVSQGKADSAYTAVVGIERRDPSVIHWREGNAVSVRVFPCMPDTVRKVKIGFTTPLRKENDQLIYENILFEGPPALSAKAQTVIYGADKVVSENLDFDKKDKKWEHNGKYHNEGWSAAFACPPLSNDAFSYNKKSYRVSEHTPQYEAFEPAEIYLDINKTWKDVFEKVWEKVKSKTVYAYHNNKMVRLDESNIQEVGKDLMKQNFSVFPLYAVKNPENALVITQNTAYTPDFKDLKGSPFEEAFSQKIPSGVAIRVFSVGETTFWKTLKQLRLARVQQGNWADLDKILTQRIFLKNDETTEKLVIEPAQIMITQDTAQTQNQATDHLFRMWAYNKALTMIGKNYFDKNYNTEWVVQLAVKANVVTPVSSLIVLETQADYDRFDIKRDKNALGNAALHGAGAAPEPHEWALIGLGISVILWTLRKRKIAVN